MYICLLLFTSLSAILSAELICFGISAWLPTKCFLWSAKWKSWTYLTKPQGEPCCSAAQRQEKCRYETSTWISTKHLCQDKESCQLVFACHLLERIYACWSSCHSAWTLLGYNIFGWCLLSSCWYQCISQVLSGLGLLPFWTTSQVRGGIVEVQSGALHRL